MVIHTRRFRRSPSPRYIVCSYCVRPRHGTYSPRSRSSALATECTRHGVIRPTRTRYGVVRLGSTHFCRHSHSLCSSSPRHSFSSFAPVILVLATSFALLSLCLHRRRSLFCKLRCHSPSNSVSYPSRLHRPFFYFVAFAFCAPQALGYSRQRQIVSFVLFSIHMRIHFELDSLDMPPHSSPSPPAPVWHTPVTPSFGFQLLLPPSTTDLSVVTSVEVVSLAIDATAGVGVTFGVGRITRHVVRRFDVCGLRWVRTAAARRGGVESGTDVDSVEILETLGFTQSEFDYITREIDPSYPLGRESDTYPAIDILTHAYQHLVGSLLRVDSPSVGGANSILKPKKLKKKRKDPPLPEPCPMSFKRLSQQNSASFLPGRALTQCEPCIFGKQARLSAPTSTTRGSKLGAKCHEYYLLGYPPGQCRHRVRSIATTLSSLDQPDPDIPTTFELLDTAPTLQPPHLDTESSHSPESSPAAVFTTLRSSHLQTAPSRLKAVRIRSFPVREAAARRGGGEGESGMGESGSAGGEGGDNPFVALCNSGVLDAECTARTNSAVMAASLDATDDYLQRHINSLCGATLLFIWEAEIRTDATEWQRVTEKELGDLKRMGVYEDSDALPEGKKAIGCRWVYEFKIDESGSPPIYNTCLGVQGFSRAPFVDHGTFTPVVKSVMVRFVAIYSALQGWHLQRFDTTRAFLWWDSPVRRPPPLPPNLDHALLIHELKSCNSVMQFCHDASRSLLPSRSRRQHLSCNEQPSRWVLVPAVLFLPGHFLRSSQSFSILFRAAPSTLCRRSSSSTLSEGYEVLLVALRGEEGRGVVSISDCGSGKGRDRTSIDFGVCVVVWGKSNQLVSEETKFTRTSWGTRNFSTSRTRLLPLRFCYRPFHDFLTAFSPRLPRFSPISAISVRFFKLSIPQFRWFSPSLHLICPSSVPASSDLIHTSHHHISCSSSWFLHHSSSLVHLHEINVHAPSTGATIRHAVVLFNVGHIIISSQSSPSYSLSSLSSLPAFCWHFVFSSPQPSLPASWLYHPSPVSHYIDIFFLFTSFLAARGLDWPLAEGVC